MIHFKTLRIIFVKFLLEPCHLPDSSRPRYTSEEFSHLLSLQNLVKPAKDQMFVSVCPMEVNDQREREREKEWWREGKRLREKRNLIGYKRRQMGQDSVTVVDFD